MIASPVPGRWLAPLHTTDEGRLRLLCFPYAGGGASVYRAWAAHLPPEIALCPVQLPGRETRMREPPFRDVGPLARALADVLEAQLGQPYALFGHSMGALVAFELARELRRRRAPLPVQLFVSARPAPQLPRGERPLYDLPDEQFVAQLRRLGGTSEAVLRNAELMRLLAPLLRADLAVNEAYSYVPEAPLACPITAFGGLSDTKVSRDLIEAWEAQTSGAFRLAMLPGDHFFVTGCAPLMAGQIAAELMVQ